MLKQIIFLLTLSVIGLTCSGCATILGGIIGYQSGELAAGLAIGAAVDFGDDIARGIGQMTANEKNFARDFQKKSTFNAQKGEITIPINPFNQKRTMDIASRLQDVIQKNGWTCQQVEKTVHDPLICPDRWTETWHCTTDTGQPFAFKIDFSSDRDTRFRIQSIAGCAQKTGSEAPPNLTQEQTTNITSQLYQWLEQVVISGSLN